MKMITTTPLSDAEQEAKTAFKWFKNGAGWISKNPKKSLGAIILLIVLVVVLFVVLYKTFLKKEILITQVKSIGNDEKTTLNLSTSLYLDKITDMEINNTYQFEMYIITYEDISTENLIYFIPVFEKGIKTPIAINYSDSDFTNIPTIKKTLTIKGYVDTTTADVGSYNMCVKVKDKINTKRIYIKCDDRILKVTQKLR